MKYYTAIEINSYTTSVALKVSIFQRVLGYVCKNIGNIQTSRDASNLENRVCVASYAGVATSV